MTPLGAFQFTPVVRRATEGVLDKDGNVTVSIHARRATGDPDLEAHRVTSFKFQFTPVVRRATKCRDTYQRDVNVSIHARRATGDGRY